MHFIAQYEGSLEEAHAKTLFATVYDMYVDDWEVVDASGAAGQAASAASGALSASVSLASFLRVGDNSLTAAAPCEPSAAASGAPSDVAATPGAETLL